MSVFVLRNRCQHGSDTTDWNFGIPLSFPVVQRLASCKLVCPCGTIGLSWSCCIILNSRASVFFSLRCMVCFQSEECSIASPLTRFHSVLDLWSSGDWRTWLSRTHRATTVAKGFPGRTATLRTFAAHQHKTLLLTVSLFSSLVQVTDRAIGEQWVVLRRFRQFEELHRALLPVLSREPDANAYVLPPKEVRRHTSCVRCSLPPMFVPRCWLWQLVEGVVAGFCVFFFKSV